MVRHKMGLAMHPPAGIRSRRSALAAKERQEGTAISAEIAFHVASRRKNQAPFVVVSSENTEGGFRRAAVPV